MTMTDAPPATPTPSSVVIPDAVINAIVESWIGRVKAQGLPTTGAKYQRLEYEFFAGAMAGLFAMDPNVQTPMRWYVAAIRGERIVPIEKFQ